MSRLVVRAERIKLETLLDKGAGELDWLESLSLDTLTTLRDQITTVLFEGHASLFERLAGAGGVMPMKIRVLIAEKALGATLCARVAGYTPVDRAVAMAENLHVPFMADVAMRMDPHRAKPLLERLSLNHIKGVAHELARREAVITLGRFVDAMPIAVTEAVMREMDDAAVLRSAFFVNDRAHLDNVTRLLPEERLSEIIATARARGLYQEALMLMQSVGPDLERRLSELAADEPGFLAGLIEEVHRERLWPDTLPLAHAMAPDSRSQLLQVPRLADEEVLRGLLDACESDALWAELEPLGSELTDDARAGLTHLAAEMQLNLPASLRG